MTLEKSVGNQEFLTNTDLVRGTLIACSMFAVFLTISSGLSLIVTFCPGIAVAYGTYFWIWKRRIPLPDPSTFLLRYFLVLSVQFIHFAEEFVTGFPERFPALYGGAPYSENTFVIFNMLAYVVFALTPFLALQLNLRFLLMPAIFFVVYGAAGNAIAHTWWSVYLQSYFPGFFTALIYWGLAPWLLLCLLGRMKNAVIVMVALAAILIPLLTYFIRSVG